MSRNIEQERATDVLDQANNTTEMLVAAGMSHVADALAPETHPDFNGKDCVECGDPLHPARLAMQRVRCTECQQQHEKEQRLFPKQV